MEDPANTLVGKAPTSPSFPASENEPPQTVRPSSTATTATITSGAASMSGKSVECPGCKKVIDQSSGGVVVAFGKSLWHVDCFRCVKCHNRVTADTNLLLLSDGDPVCGNCSYQCYVCKLPITEEAIMTGDESYHAHCFTCRACSNKIEELVFAKTSQGIYCMSCHNERVARSRRHAEAKQRAKAKKEEREREKAKSTSDQVAASPLKPLPPMSSSSSTAIEDAMKSASTFGPNSLASQALKSPIAGPTRALSPSSQYPKLSPDGSSFAHPDGQYPKVHEKLLSLSPVPDARERTAARLESRRRKEEQVDLSSYSPTPSPSPGSRSVFDDGRLDRLSPRPGSDLGSPLEAKFKDDTLRARSPILTQDQSANPTIGLGVGPVSGLGLPTGRAERRRSINPAMMFNYQDHQNTPELPHSPSHPSFVNQHVEGATGSRGSPLPSSPLRSSFNDGNPRAQNGPSTRGTSPMGNSVLSPIPNRLYSSGSNRENSNSRSDLAAVASQDDLKSNTPPRSSSLADSLHAATAFGSDRRPSASTESTRTVSPGIRRLEATPGASMVPTPVAGSPSAPQIDAPELPSLNFSLSDPDFAVILNEQEEKSAIKADQSFTRPSLQNNRSNEGSGLAFRQLPSISKIQPLNLPSKDGSSRPSPSSPAYSPHGGVSPKLLSNAANRVAHDIRQTPSSEMSDTFFSSDSGHKDDNESQDSAASQLDHDNSSSLRVESALPQLQLLLEATRQQSGYVAKIEVALLAKTIQEITELTEQVSVFSQKYTGAKRTSQHYMEGLGVAHEEYAKEVALRLEAEAEIARLRTERHDQHARLSLIVNEERRQEDLKRRSNDLAMNLSGLEKDVSKLKVERDIALAEVEELVGTKDDVTTQPADPAEQHATLTRSITSKLNNLKDKYRRELEPLDVEKQVLKREIGDLRDTRNLYLEESVALSAKNEELADLNTRLSKQTEAMQDMINRHHRPPHLRNARQHISGSPSMSSLTTSSTLHELPDDMLKGIKAMKLEPLETAPAARRFKNKWYKSSKGPEIQHTTSASISKPLTATTERIKARPSHDPGMREHVFQPHSILRFCKCEHCGDKMWGLQEYRCAEKLNLACNAANSIREEPVGDAPPSMFGRTLNEQIAADGHSVPVIVTKCIEAVEAQAMDHEGVYRKTGGSSLSKQITQLFERGQYDAFDLQDSDRFNDINSITSVLKNYFRQLPNPLLTYELHESFVTAASIKDAEAKSEALTDLTKRLPKEHYDVLGYLMLHLHRVKNNSGENLMNARNLGVVFGPTLMRSSDPAREFADMAGKALSIEWMVENAPTVFQRTENP
ncbi:hypothetical protein QFC22_005481 [Naganishia vaughanmartiniae]|uniref:Uncharacterized protein n=1 Tax=Naganishia vaughanmartiniae TaxID=1424756 RepID=A0ACC2WS40_9TREE|nr:hypothetical protein QFC22_005481 [Naganishia vaughanmartiniae]